MIARSVFVGALVATSVPVLASAQTDDADTPLVQPASIATETRDGAVLPSTLTARVGSTRAVAFGFAGYDAARSAPLGSAVAEVRVWGPVAIRGGAEYSDARGAGRPMIGGRVQLLHQDRHGVDGSVSVFYRAEGFTEPEGEIETFVSVQRRFGALAVLGNLVYGQDPEGNERDGEIRFASLYGSGRWTVGVDSRLRFAIGTQRGAAAISEPKLDLLAGPIVLVTTGPLALFAQAGPTLFEVANRTSVGVAALAGVGSVF